MDFRINKDSEFPIYQQLKEQIRYFILNGTMQPGTRVPTPKDLGTYLTINKNTVIAAYKELEIEGLLVTRHGQGTYISEKLPALPDEERRQALMTLVQDAIEKAAQLGFQKEDLFTLIFNQTVIGLKPENSRKFNALIVECNLPDLHYFQKILKNELDIEIGACLVSELQDKIGDDMVINADFIITSVIHIEDVKAILESLHKEVLAINAAPHLQTFMRVAQLPEGTRVGVVCGTEQGACRMKTSLEDAGINSIKIEHCSSNDTIHMTEMLKRVDWVITSRMAYENMNLKASAPSGVKFMEFFNELDKAGIEMLKQYLLKIQSK